MNQIFEIGQWAGTDSSLSLYQSQIDKLMQGSALVELLAKGPQKTAFTPTADQPVELPRLLTVADGVATISIKGPLNNSDSWLNAYMGYVGYGEIRQALVQAATDPAVKSVVLDINSGGGAVSGCADCADLIASVDAIKPVTAFSDGSMMSAAYWLGASTRNITITKSAEVGSIGVLAVHTDQVNALEKAGITPTIFRSGKYKALGHSAEHLSTLAVTEIQAGVDHSAQIFTQHVADHRLVTYAVANDTMGQGRIFAGEKAVSVGLADNIGTFDSVISKAQKVVPKQNLYGGIASVETAPQYADHSTNQSLGPDVKKPLTEQQIAALAAGGIAVTAEVLTPEAEALAAAAIVAEAAAATLVAETAAAAAVVEAAAKPAPASDVITYLQGQLAASQESVIDLTVQVRDAKAAHDSLQNNHVAMRAITVASVDHLRVALGHAAGGAASMSDTELLASHTTLRGQFETKFKAGGVAAVSADASAHESDKNEFNPIRHARIKATRLK